MKTIKYLTSNILKFQIAQKALGDSGVVLEQIDLETPEIQSMDVLEIATYSAKWASKELNQAVALTDHGFYFDGLNGFPGPFIKYINKWLTSEDLLRLMSGVKNRRVTVKGCLAYCEPGAEPIIFTSEIYGTLSETAVKTEKGGTSINEIFIPDGYDKVETQLTKDEVLLFYSGRDKYWEKLAEYISDKSK